MRTKTVRDRVYHIWYKMKRRCQDPSDKDYENYGMRGIQVCDEWQDIDSFYEWAIANGYEYGLKIERLDNDGDYEPENCAWATAKEQANNRRSSMFISYAGETKTISSWADKVDIPYPTLWRRIMVYRWDVGTALTEPCGKRHIIEYNGVLMRLCDWSRYLGISYDVLDTRINQRGWDIERAFTQPVKLSTTRPTRTICSRTTMPCE